MCVGIKNPFLQLRQKESCPAASTPLSKNKTYRHAYFADIWDCDCFSLLLAVLKVVWLHFRRAGIFFGTQKH